MILAIVATALVAQIARVEVHPFETRTVTDREFLTGSKDGKTATIGGALRIPRPGNDRLPVVVLIHGSGGPSGYVDDWALLLNSMGVATFQVDSFTGRKLTSVVADQTLLPRFAQVEDAYRALAILAAHPRIDPQRIVLMGFSRGGGVVLYSAMKRLQRLRAPQGVSYAGYLVFYPNCITSYREDTDLVDRPIRIFHGAADDWNPVAPCKAYVERLREAGRNVTLTVYPEASHNFDAQTLPAEQKVPQGQTNRGCKLHENAEGLIVTDSGEPFTWSHPCVERAPTIGHNPAARAAAQTAVREFVMAVLKPG
jgi:dienelactone hydrolase